MSAMVNTLTENEQMLVRETETGQLAQLDEDGLVDLHLRRMTYTGALRSGRLRLEGSPPLARKFRSWFRTSPFADYLPQHVAGPSIGHVAT